MNDTFEIFKKLKIGSIIIYNKTDNYKALDELLIGKITAIEKCKWKESNQCRFKNECIGYIRIDNKKPDCYVWCGKPIIKEIINNFEFEKELFEV